MDILNFIEAWILSLRRFLEASGIGVQFERTTDHRRKASCLMTLRRNTLEVELIVWESGEADLTTMDALGKAKQEHVDGISVASGLGALLARVLNAVSDR
jgi:hypothetical protein